MVRLEGAIDDEIDHYQNLRCIGALEACSRLLSLPQCARMPAVEPLAVHLPQEQVVFFPEGGERRVVADLWNQRTQPTEFFAYNSQNPGTGVKYDSFPEQFVWSKVHRMCSPRRVKNGTIGRIYTVHPSSGDRFYLRMLLHHEFCEGKFHFLIIFHQVLFLLISGKKSFEDMKIVNGVSCDSYQMVCSHLGLLADETEWNKVLEESCAVLTSPKFRQFFVTLLVFCEIPHPISL